MTSRFPSSLILAALCAAVATSAHAQRAGTSRTSHHNSAATTDLARTATLRAAHAADEAFDGDGSEVEWEDADADDVAAQPYDLQIASIHTPVPEFVSDTAARLMVEVTVKNAGTESAPVARLVLDETDGGVHRAPRELFVPAIAPGKSVTIRVPVAYPTSADGMICVSGTVEPLVRPAAPVNGVLRAATPLTIAQL